MNALRSLLALPSLLALGSALLLAACSNDGGTPEPGAEAAAEPTEGIVLADVGFDTPESVLHDTEADIYLVSNVGGNPTARDGDGFISRVSPEGEVEELEWIDGSDDGVELHAPKGMAILGDSLYVADIDCVRIFVRTTGAHTGDVCMPDATFLNDVGVDENNVLYVTDSGTGAEGRRTDAIYRFAPDGRFDILAEGEDLGAPNGIAFSDRGGFVVTFESGEIYQLMPDGARNPVLPPSDRVLDGIAFTPEGGFLFSNWSDSTVYMVRPNGQVFKAVEQVPEPADIGFDAGRSRVLIPLIGSDEVWIREIEGLGGGEENG